MTDTLLANRPRPATVPARALNRAIGDLRRGVAVLIEKLAITGGRGDVAMMALPAETATPATLAEFRDWAAADPLLILTASRAAALLSEPGLSEPGLQDLARPAERSPALVLALDPARLDPAMLRALADPTMAAPAMALGRPRRAMSGEPAQAALRLAKQARLLPVLLLAPCRERAMPPDLLRVRETDILAAAQDPADGLIAVAETSVKLAGAESARIVAFRPPDGGTEHLAILIGDPRHAPAPLVRVHSECFTGDRLGSLRCDCGPQLERALDRMRAEGAGVLLYMAQEGRGIGLINKLRAYALQDEGLDTLDANRALGFEGDERDFAAAATMLRELGIARIRLLTNNPDKIATLSAHGIDVAGRVAHAIAANGVNNAYLDTKRIRFGHLPG